MRSLKVKGKETWEQIVSVIRALSFEGIVAIGVEEPGDQTQSSDEDNTVVGSVSGKSNHSFPWWMMMDEGWWNVRILRGKCTELLHP